VHLKSGGKIIQCIFLITIILFVLDVVKLCAQLQMAADDEIKILIKKIVVKGNKVIDTETLQKVTEPYQNKELTLEEMGEVVDLVTITYQEKGYILARAFLPEQDIKEGILIIAVMEGNIGKIKVSGKTHYNENVIKRYFKQQLEHGVIKESYLEKGILLSSETPKLKTNVVLKKGEKPGDVDVILDTEDTFVATFGLTLGFDYNNYGSPAVSDTRFGTTINIIDHNWGSLLELRGVMGNHVQDSLLGTLRWIVPVNSYGTKFSVNLLQSNYAVGQDLADLGLEGHSSFYGAEVLHPLIVKKNANMNLAIGYEHKYVRSIILDQDRAIDETGVFHLALNFDSLDRFLGKNIFSLGLSFGEIDYDDNLSPSRLGADQHFEHINLNLVRIQKIYGYTNLLVRASGQLSNDRLLPIEMFVIGGYGSVRGYDPSLFLGDSGYTLSAELMLPPPFIKEKNVFGQKLAQLMQIALFVDNGGVYVTEPTETEYHDQILTGAGIGLRLFYKDKFVFRYDYAVPLDKIEGQKDYYNYFSFALNFF